jgi:hypothetical protein
VIGGTEVHFWLRPLDLVCNPKNSHTSTPPAVFMNAYILRRTSNPDLRRRCLGDGLGVVDNGNEGIAELLRPTKNNTIQESGREKKFTYPSRKYAVREVGVYVKK